MRINDGGQFRLKGDQSFRPLNTLVTQSGQSWSGRVSCFKTNPKECTLVARWDADYADPWLIVTDLEPHLADACWYGMRSKIECLFKDSKRGGWQWHQTKITDPKRAERQRLAIARATLWVQFFLDKTGQPSIEDICLHHGWRCIGCPVLSGDFQGGEKKPHKTKSPLNQSRLLGFTDPLYDGSLVLWALSAGVVSVGGEADATLPASSFDALPDTPVSRQHSTGSKPPRTTRLFSAWVFSDSLCFAEPSTLANR